MAKYSVIMPIYNKEAYVEKSIKSVQDQGCGDWEIIAVDDESKDRSLEIVQRLAAEDSRIKVFAIKNEGVSNARNFALSKASGEYVTFLDADDTFNSGLFEKYDEILGKCDADIVFTDFEKVDDKYNVLSIVQSGITEGEYNANEAILKIAKLQEKNGFFGFIANKLVRASLIYENKIEFDTRIKLSEDVDFYTRLYAIAEVFYFTEFKSFNYVIYSQNSSTTMTVDYYSQIVVYMRLRDMLCARGVLSENDKNSISNRRISSYIACYITEQLPDSYKAFCEKQKRLYANREAMASITIKGFPIMRKIMLCLAKARMCRAQYLILTSKRAVGRLIRR